MLNCIDIPLLQSQVKHQQKRNFTRRNLPNRRISGELAGVGELGSFGPPVIYTADSRPIHGRLAADWRPQTFARRVPSIKCIIDSFGRAVSALHVLGIIVTARYPHYTLSILSPIACINHHPHHPHHPHHHHHQHITIITTTLTLKQRREYALQGSILESKYSSCFPRVWLLPVSPVPLPLSNSASFHPN